MKLVLSNNQSDRFTQFFAELKAVSGDVFDYCGYLDLVYVFNQENSVRADAYNVLTGKRLTDYDGVYINGYLNVYELAAAVAICCEASSIPFVNRELSNPPSLSKLTGYAKLAAAGVPVPPTLAGSKSALLNLSDELLRTVSFPAVLKRADADRGIDNFKVQNYQEVQDILSRSEEKSVWVLQDFIENEGFYLVSYYDGQPEFAIYRTLEQRPDGNEQKAHMFKPAGGVNATLLDVVQVPEKVIDAATGAIEAMNRQIGSVDCLYNPRTGRVYVLEVNYNPQLVTIETFKEVRKRAFIEGVKKIK